MFIGFPADVQPLTLSHSGYQLFPDLCLGLAQHILDDPLTGLGIVSGGVPSLPAAVFALADISLAVGSFLWHIDRLLSATQHTTSFVK